MRKGSEVETKSFPVRPDLDRLEEEARDLLRATRLGDPSAAHF
jgi:hypothetical protein